jgi:hypothetical protein
MGMGRLRMQEPFGMGAQWPFAHAPGEPLGGEAMRKAASMGLWRVAGNAFICESKKDFWKIRGNRIVRLVGDEVDNGDSLAAAPEDDPGEFLDGLLGDLTF